MNSFRKLFPWHILWNNFKIKQWLANFNSLSLEKSSILFLPKLLQIIELIFLT